MSYETSAGAQGSRPDRQIARDWQSQKAQKSKETAGTSINLHNPTFTDSSLGIGTVNGGTFNAGPSSNMSRNKANDNVASKQTINEYFSVIPPSRPSNVSVPLQQSMPPEIQEDTCYVTSDNNDNEDTNDDDYISDNKSTYTKDPNYFDTLIDNVDLSYIGREEEPIHEPLTSTISVVNSWDSFKIDDADILKIFDSL
ncbi:3305_t:CDS:2, partial [Cetraspora pellucida]